MSPVQVHIINAGVKNLHEFGYPECNADNIMTDYIYSAFFKSMLKDNRGLGIDSSIDELLTLLESQSRATKI